MKNKIITERNSTNLSFFQVTYEWEDILAKILNIDFYSTRKKLSNNQIQEYLSERLMSTFPFKTNKSRWNIVFIMYPRLSHRYKFKSIIPIYLDVHKKWKDKIISDTRRLPIYFVTSLDLYEDIKKTESNSECVYLPLSVSDIYYVQRIPKKSVEVVQLGRKNRILHEFMLKYCETKDVDYIFNNNGTYNSIKNGNIGQLSTRQEYMSLLAKAKVSLVSTPSVDGDKDFGGYDFFTPRFYESAISYCYMIGRYTHNSESKLLDIDRVCEHVDNYEEFKNAMNYMLSNSIETHQKEYDNFIDKNTTSNRANDIKRKIKEKGFKV